MLQPKTYPEMVGKALVLDADPFLTMVEDDNPWVEGLFLVTCVGVLVAVADVVGGLLLTASMPPLTALRETMQRGIEAFLPWAGLGALDAPLAAMWSWGVGVSGLGGGWARLFFALWVPVFLVVQWLFLGASTHVAARALGGNGTLVQTLGTTALAVGPQILGVLKIVPFVSVSGLLLTVWALLIAYRAVAITHDLPWRRAALATLAVPALLLVLALGMAALLGAWMTVGG